jgi:hypothetical protein
MERFPPALAARATTRILELLGDPPASVLELGFGGIHAVPLRLAGFDVFVVDGSPAARERAGETLSSPPSGHVDAVVAPDGADLRGIDADRRLLVRRDGSVVLG